MGLHEWLLPNENVHYTSPKTIEYGGTKLYFYITDQRIVLYNKKGLIFKKEAVVAERLDDIQTMDYKEKGIVKKKATLTIQTEHKNIRLDGKPPTIKVVWHALQQYVKR